MTDRAQFEAMLEALINEDQEAAKEIFHNIVVGKSREIYEELLAEDFSAEEANNAIGGHSKNEGMEEEEESMEEDSEEEEGEEEESDGEKEENPFGSEDDEEGEEDGAEDEFGGEEDGEGEGDIEDRVMDLEDALEDLKAEFEQLLQGEEHEEENEPGIHGDGMPMHDIEADMHGGMEDEAMPMMEYYKKVSVTHGDNGVNNKSTVDNMKNDMGGTTANIAQSFSTEKGGTTGGLAKNTAGDLTKGMNVHNRVQSNAGKTAFKKQEPGHGPEKKGKGETAGTDKKSTISTRVR
jgi:hypothetical protein